MIGMHVHHHPPRSQGGRNIPEHLYVCSPSIHYLGWHMGEIGCGGGVELLHAAKDEYGRSIQGVKNAERLHAEKDEFGRSIQGVKAGERLMQFAKLAGTKAATTMWEDPLHPEIGTHNAGNLVQRQRKLGLPHGKENRKKVYTDSV
jgi:hypothetical protein